MNDQFASSDYVGFIYEWTNCINQKKYIGSHIGSINDGYVGSGVHFKRAVNKYGISNFSRSILEFVQDKHVIYERELVWLIKHNVHLDSNYYNQTLQSGPGWSHVNDYEHIKLDCNKRAGETRTKKLKSGEIIHPKGFLNKTHSDDSKHQISQTTKETFVQRGYCSKVFAYDFDGSFVCEYFSLSDAAKQIKGSASNIKLTCDGKFSHAYGFQWSYEKHLLIDPFDLMVHRSKTSGRAKPVVVEGKTFESLIKASKYLQISYSTAQKILYDLSDSKINYFAG